MKIKDTEPVLLKCIKLIDQGRYVRTKAGYRLVGKDGRQSVPTAKARKLFRLARREMKYGRRMR